MNRIAAKPSVSLLAVAAAIFLVYLRTGAPGAWWGDGPELACAAKTLGIPHPTGYPLYTILGWTAMHALAWIDPGRALTILSAILCAASAWIMGALALRRLASADSDDRIGFAPIVLAAGCMILWGFSRAVWSHATFAEVYPLTLLLSAAIVALVERGPGPRARRRVAALGALCGLAGLNHYSIVALGPFVALAIVDWSRCAEARARARLVAANLGLFFGVSAFFLFGYLYLPLRAATNPPLNWGDPSSLKRLLWVLRGGDFVGGNFLSGGSVFASASAGFGVWLRWWGEQAAPDSLAALRVPLGVAISGGALWGCRLIAKRSPLLGWGLASSIAMSAAIVSLYRILDPEGYVFPAMPAAFLGWIELLRAARGRWPALARSRPLPLLAPALGVLLLSLNWAEVDKSWDDGPRRWADAALGALPEGAVIITRGRMDSEVFALWQEQMVYGRRRDVTVFGAGFIFQGWHKKYFEAEGRPRVPIYVGDRPPEDKALYDAALIGGVILPNLAERRVFVTFEDDILANYFSPRRAAILLPPSYYEATLYKIRPPGPFLYELKAPPNFFSNPPTRDEMLRFFTEIGPEHRRRYLELFGDGP